MENKKAREKYYIGVYCSIVLGIILYLILLISQLEQPFVLRDVLLFVSLNVDFCLIVLFVILCAKQNKKLHIQKKYCAEEYRQSLQDLDKKRDCAEKQQHLSKQAWLDNKFIGSRNEEAAYKQYKNSQREFDDVSSKLNQAKLRTPLATIKYENHIFSNNLAIGIGIIATIIGIVISYVTYFC